MNSGGFFFILIFTSSLAQAAIFGADTRERVFANSASAPLARATAIAVLSSNQSADGPGLIKLETDPLSELLCSDEKFANDPSLSYSCTGFLVAPDLLVTAGHCMVNTGEVRNETGSYCEVYSWLFDFQSDANGKTQLSAISSKRLYSCKKIIYAIREEGAPYRDFALVQLDRPVTDRTPLKLATQPVGQSDQVTMIGYPFGTPAKLSLGAHVLINSTANQAFITNLDAFEGNSGSPVFNARSEVVGILVGGTPMASTKTDTNRSCERYNHCDENGEHCEVPDLLHLPDFQGTGSIVQRIEAVLDLLAGQI
jgi:V8-like Glu-specific endopeptidase